MAQLLDNSCPTRLLALESILNQKTDENYPLTTPQLIEELNNLGLSADRKTIYRYIQVLKDFGMDIENAGPRKGYYVLSRTFEIPELKLLIDAISSEKFITEKKTRQLISKIKSLASTSQIKQLEQQIYLSGRVKTNNEQIYYNIDTLYSAIYQKHQIHFLYFNYTIKKEKSYHHDKTYYTADPYALICDNENYYLIAYYERRHEIVHFRVDKMENIQISEQKRLAPPNDFNVLKYYNKIFNMFPGEECLVTLEAPNELANSFFDRFGMNINLHSYGDDCFRMTSNIMLSPTFFAWVFQFNGQIKIISPEEAVEEFKDMARQVLQ